MSTSGVAKVPPNPAFFLSLAAAAAGGAALESASRGGAGARSAAQRAVAACRPRPGLEQHSWLNSDHPLTLSELKGRVVLLNFWVFTCWNCTNTVPSLVDFDRKYRDQGLTIIGIHTPEFPPYAGEHDRGTWSRPPEVRHRIPQRAGQRLEDLGPLRHSLLAQLRADRQARNIRYEGYGEFHLNDGTYPRGTSGSGSCWRSDYVSVSTVRIASMMAGATRGSRLFRVMQGDVPAPDGGSGARLPRADTRRGHAPWPRRPTDPTRGGRCTPDRISSSTLACPALETTGGTVLRFASGRLTSDSAYFASRRPPCCRGGTRTSTGPSTSACVRTSAGLSERDRRALDRANGSTSALSARPLHRPTPTERPIQFTAADS